MKDYEFKCKQGIKKKKYPCIFSIPIKSLCVFYHIRYVNIKHSTLISLSIQAHLNSNILKNITNKTTGMKYKQTK